MKSKEVSFCLYENITIQICSWNLDSRKPSDLEANDNAFIEKWLTSVDSPDVIVFGFQELVDLESVILQFCLIDVDVSKCQVLP